MSDITPTQPKTKEIPPPIFDRELSLAIDAAHDRLDALAYQRGLWAWLRRWWVRVQLRRLEAHICD